MTVEWFDVDQHPGEYHCDSCLEDVEYDPGYAVGDYLCCCRSKVESDDDTIEGILAFGEKS